MAGDPLKLITSGQPYEPSASRENALTEAALWVRQQRSKSNAPSFREDLLPSGIVRVQNTTGVDLPRGAILGLGPPVILPTENLAEYESRIALTGVTPVVGHAGKFCVLAEPLLPGALGRAWIDGTPQVEIEMVDDTHRFAEVQASTARLKSAKSGSARILWVETGTGNKSAIVRLGSELPAGVSVDGEGGGGGGCCCDPNNCLLDSDGAPVVPESFYFAIAKKSDGGFNCDCSVGDESNGGVVLLEATTIGGNVFRSPTITCPGPLPTTIDCTVTATWEWVAGGNCNTGAGDCVYTAVPDGASPTGYVWGLPVNTCANVPGCICSESYPPGHPTGSGDTYSVGCGGTANGHWNLVGVDDPDCNCTPVEPDFEGTTPGDQAETTCDGTKDGPDGVGDYDSYWEFERGLTDYNGRSICRLSFKVGTGVVLSYITTSQSGCCTYCENKLELETCGPFQCKNVRSVICLVPGRPAIEDTTVICRGITYTLPDVLTYAMTPNGQCTGNCINFLTLTCPMVENNPTNTIWRSTWVKLMSPPGFDRQNCWNLPDDPEYDTNYPNSDLWLWVRAVITMVPVDPLIHDECFQIGAFLEVCGGGFDEAGGLCGGGYTSGTAAHALLTEEDFENIAFSDCVSGGGGVSAATPKLSICGYAEDSTGMGYLAVPPVCFQQTISVPTP